MTDRIRKTEEFLRKKLAESPYFLKKPEAERYRMEHSVRVARIAGEIARAEHMDEEAAIIAGLLHDVSYCREFENDNDWQNHGRDAARIARTFLESMDFPEEVAEDICYGIAIHVDNRSDFDGVRSPFALTVMDADNIDRFDVYRLYETLEYVGYGRLSAGEKRSYVEQILGKLDGYLVMDLATPTATKLWRERITYYQDFYRRLLAQLDAGCGYCDTKQSGEVYPKSLDRLMQLSGHF